MEPWPKDLDTEMAILVDEAIWPWRGRRWAHLVSDSHFDELHELAHRLGLPYLAFQGDHYDVHEDLRVAAIGAGARPTPARDLVRAMRAAGLRRRGPMPHWRWHQRQILTANALGDDPFKLLEGQLADLVGARVNGTVAAASQRFLETVDQIERLDQIGTAQRPEETLIVASTERTVVGPAGIQYSSPSASVHRSSGERGTYVELVLHDFR